MRSFSSVQIVKGGWFNHFLLANSIEVNLCPIHSRPTKHLLWRQVWKLGKKLLEKFLRFKSVSFKYLMRPGMSMRSWFSLFLLGLKNTDAILFPSSSLFGEMTASNYVISFSSCKQPVEPLTLEEIAERCHCEDDV